MTDFFDDLGKRIGEAAGDIGRKAEEAIEVQRIKSDIRSLKRGNERDYADMGKLVYRKFKEHEVLDLELIPFCEAVEKREERIEEQKEKISRIKEEF